MISDKEKEAIQRHYLNFSKCFNQFKNREPQRLMIAEIAEVFGNAVDPGTKNKKTKVKNGDSILVVEGPTGVGKSFAYLLAGTVMAQFRKKCLIISTATISLQQQLIHKDLPDFERSTGLKVSYTLAKGRSHYLCPYRLYELADRSRQGVLANFEDLVMTEEERHLEAYIPLIKSIKTSFQKRHFLGDREDWPEHIPNSIWNKINNDRHICLKQQCPNIKECPHLLIREEFNQIDIIVTNHDLLLSDLELGGGVLLPPPGNCFYCIDEAHHLPQKAIQHFSGSHTLSQGLLLFDQFNSFLGELGNISELIKYVEAINKKLDHLHIQWNQWQGYLKSIPSEKYQPSFDNKIDTWILREEDYNIDFKQMVSNTAGLLRDILDQLNAVKEVLIKPETDNSDKDKYAYVELLKEFHWISNIIIGIEYVWSLFNQNQKVSDVPLARWIIRNKNGQLDFEFHASPIGVAEHLSEIIWSKSAGAVLTSATLKSCNSFDLILSKTGLNRFSLVKTLALDSPFNLSEQAELHIPDFVNTPKEADLHTQEIITCFPQLVDLACPTGTLVLFSSKKQLSEVYQGLPENYRRHILVQGSTNKNQIIEQHTKQITENHTASIIFGLDSFAEGLDLKGDLCVHVIIAKIPFSVPDNPVDKVYADWITQQGRNPFFEVVIPEASIKLAQAMGRLIRSEEDYGRVTILDNRLIKSYYGQILMSNFPKFKRI